MSHSTTTLPDGPPTHTLDDEGDVLIILRNPNEPFAVYDGESSDKEEPTPEPQADVTYRVSSKHLKIASPVFKNMLSPEWKEGKKLQESGQVTIKAFSWDSDALLLFLSVLHCKAHEIDYQPDLELLAQLAVIGDYYQCRKLVSFHADAWVSRLPVTSPVHVREMMLWIWVAFWFGRAALFENYTAMVIRESEDPVTSLGLPFPSKVIDKINEARTSYIGRIFNALDLERHSLLNDARCSYECCALVLGGLMKQMHDNDLLCSDALLTHDDPHSPRGLRPPQPTAPYHGFRFDDLKSLVLGFRPLQATGIKHTNSSHMPPPGPLPNPITDTYQHPFGGSFPRLDFIIHSVQWFYDEFDDLRGLEVEGLKLADLTCD
ncbi:hypothetical protein BJX61DRAFT_544041 [Aspergillus egyptiacus]|nr:hypothetical protein BJX61DRAFT_544041 [Aspergillus egyptiacus]